MFSEKFCVFTYVHNDGVTKPCSYALSFESFLDLINSHCDVCSVSKDDDLTAGDIFHVTGSKAIMIFCETVSVDVPVPDIDLGGESDG